MNWNTYTPFEWMLYVIALLLMITLILYTLYLINLVKSTFIQTIDTDNYIKRQYRLVWLLTIGSILEILALINAIS